MLLSISQYLKKRYGDDDPDLKENFVITTGMLPFDIIFFIVAFFFWVQRNQNEFSITSLFSFLAVLFMPILYIIYALFA